MFSRLESRAHVTATHCNALQRTATHCNALQHTATHCNTLQHTATHCNTLQHTATYCNTLQHTPIGGGSRQDRNRTNKWVNMPRSQRLGSANSVANTRIEWRRPIGCITLQVIFRKRATNYRALLWEMTCKDKGSHGSLPPCIVSSHFAQWRCIAYLDHKRATDYRALWREMTYMGLRHPVLSAATSHSEAASPIYNIFRLGILILP